MLCRNEAWGVTGTYILATMSKYAHFNVKKEIGTTRGYEVRYMLKINHECPGKSIFRQGPIFMNAKHTGKFTCPMRDGKLFVGVKWRGPLKEPRILVMCLLFAPTHAINVTYPDQTIWSVFHAARAAWRVFSGG